MALVKFKCVTLLAHSVLCSIIFVVSEGNDEFIPSRKLSRHTNRNQLCQPDYILDFLFLELEVSVEDTMMELILKSLTQSL